MSITISGGTGAANAIIDATNGVSMATWTTSARPAGPVTGQMGYNTTTGVVETWNGSAWTSFNNITTNLNFAAGVNGINFNNNTSGVQTESTLNDYETGTWTPRFDGSGTSGSASYSFQSGFYTKIGNMVYASYDIAASSTLSGATGQLCIRGLPFTVASNTYDPVGGGNVGYFNSFTGVTPYTITHYLDASGNYAYFVYGNGSASTVQYMAVNNVTTNSRVIGVIFYRATF